jgi:hypothetical protein
VALGSERERERERERQMAAVDEERPLIEDDGALVVQVLSLSLSLSLSLICLCLSDLYFSFLSQWRVVPFLRLGCFSSSSLFSLVSDLFRLKINRRGVGHLYIGVFL